MAFSEVVNIDKQLSFYGAYHSNKINILIHIICVPLIVWSFCVVIVPLKVPSFFPSYHHVFNDYMVFDVNYAVMFDTALIAYYLLLEPFAAILMIPSMALNALTATAFAQRPDYLILAIAVHIFSWLAQFLGHGFAEKRAPALLDNISALVLAPFFVHVEVLFMLGYRPAMKKRINNAIGTEIAKIRQGEAAKKRKA